MYWSICVYMAVCGYAFVCTTVYSNSGIGLFWYDSFLFQYNVMNCNSVILVVQRFHWSASNGWYCRLWSNMQWAEILPVFIQVQYPTNDVRYGQAKCETKLYARNVTIHMSLNECCLGVLSQTTIPWKMHLRWNICWSFSRVFWRGQSEVIA